MSSRKMPDRFEPFNVLAWHPKTNKPARYSHSEIGNFSVDEERHFLHNKSKLGNLSLPQNCKSLDIDLNTGFEEWRELPNVQQHLDSMLYWILLNKELLAIAGDSQAGNDGMRLGVDLVTSRGNLARILDALSGKDGKGREWTLLGTLYRGTVYLSHIEDNHNDKQSKFSRRVCYWGKRFEVEVTKSRAQVTSDPGFSSAPSPANEVERHGPLKAYPGFFSVVRFQLENHRIALRAEVDAEMQHSADDERIPRSNYVELKITTETIVRAPWAFNRKRLVPWWCQSIVSGTPLIVYGIRDYNGHVMSIEQVRTDDIPDRVGRENLDAEKYLMFLNDVLSWIINIVCVKDTGAVYAFQWDPNRPGRGVTANALLPDADSAFLPEWYVNEMEDYFASAWKQNHRKGKKRKIEDETPREDHEVKMKGVRKRFEASWPRTAASEETRAKEKVVNYARSRSPGFHDVSDRGRATIEYGNTATASYQGHSLFPSRGRKKEDTGYEVDEERYSRRRTSFQRGEDIREHSRYARREEDDVRPHLHTEEQFYRDRTSTRVYDRKSPPYSHQDGRDKLDKTRTERRRHDDGVEQGARARSRKTIESRSQRFGDRSRDYPSSGDDRMSQESRVKRVKRDAEYEKRRFGYQGSTRHEYPQWN